MTKPEPHVVKRHQTCQVAFDHECTRFCLRYGYEHRNTVQVRLEDSGEVFLSVYDEARYPNRTAQVSVPFELFAKKLPEFIEHLGATKGET